MHRANYWVNWNQAWSQWSLDGPLSKLRPTGLDPNQHDRKGEPKLTLDPLEKHIQISSSLKLPSQLESNLATIVLGPLSKLCPASRGPIQDGGKR